MDVVTLLQSCIPQRERSYWATLQYVPTYIGEPNDRRSEGQVAGQSQEI